MKKLWIAIALVSTTALVACSKSDNKSEQSTAVEQTTTTTAQTTSAVGDNAENSLDWAGEYEGVFPCADCEGVKTELELKEDKTYELKSVYLGKKDTQAIKSKGSFHFDDKNPSVIVLDKNADDAKFFVGENTITALDLEGNKVEGVLADHYILRKEQK